MKSISMGHGPRGAEKQSRRRIWGSKWKCLHLNFDIWYRMWGSPRSRAPHHSSMASGCSYTSKTSICRTLRRGTHRGETWCHLNGSWWMNRRKCSRHGWRREAPISGCLTECDGSAAMSRALDSRRGGPLHRCGSHNSWRHQRSSCRNCNITIAWDSVGARSSRQYRGPPPCPCHPPGSSSTFKASGDRRRHHQGTHATNSAAESMATRTRKRSGWQCTSSTLRDLASSTPSAHRRFSMDRRFR
mmetsp:Transcript_43379/g.77959  ORF Transcript_43379/g.77959 Transcript_43379/m.77959 type:complete len:244 (+) Transcript_43379:312-1043(+)